MKPMLTIALSAAMLLGAAAPALAWDLARHEDARSIEARQQGAITSLGQLAGVEAASRQLESLVDRADRVSNESLLERLSRRVATVQGESDGQDASVVAKVLANPEVKPRPHAAEGSALVTKDYDHARHEVYVVLEQAHAQ